MVKTHKSIWAKAALFSLLIAVTFAIPGKKPTETKADQLVISNVPAVAPIAAPDLTVTSAQPATTTTVNTPVASATPTVSTNTVKPAAVPTPASTMKGLSLNIAAIGINIPLGTTGLDSAGHLAVPANGNTAAWYRLGPKPGDAGTALITGHLNWSKGDGVFINLNKLQAGDEIRVGRADGQVAVFRVDRLASYAQDNTFPWSEVYRTSGSPALRIITCDGVYSSKLGHYTRNLVVYASFVSLE